MSPVSAKAKLAAPLRANVGTTKTAKGLDPDLGIDNLIIGGGPLPEQMRKQIISADLERKMDGASTLKLVVRDPTRDLLTSPYVLNGLRCTFDGLAFRLADVSKGGDDVTLTFESEGVWKLRFKSGAKKATRGKVTRAQFAASLCREVGVKVVAPDAAKKQAIAKDADTGVGLDKAPGFAPGANVTVKGKRADKAQLDVLGKVLAVGVSLDTNDTVLLAAIVCVTQESTARNLTGGDRDSVGAFQQRASMGWPASRDVSKDARAFYDKAISLNRANATWTPGFLADGVQRSYTYGTSRQGSDYQRWLAEAKATLRAYNGSGDVREVSRGEASKKYEFTRGAPGGPKGENSWECITRLAKEVNWRAYEQAGKVYFVSDTALMRAAPLAVVKESLDWITNIDFDFSLVPTSKRLRVDVNRASIACRASRWAAAPGMVVVLEDCGPANGRWLVDRVARSLFSRDVSINLRQPEAAKAEPKATADGLVNITAGASDFDDEVLQKIYNEAKRIAGKNLPYVWGGGHGTVGTPSVGVPGGPGYNGSRIGYDCSGALGAILNAAGVSGTNVALHSSRFANIGVPGKGKYFTMYSNNQHCYVVFNLPRKGLERWAAEVSTGVGFKKDDAFGNNNAGFVASHLEGL